MYRCCRWCVPGVCATSLPNFNSPNRVWPDSAPPLSMTPTLACGVGVMHLLQSSLRRDATRVHIIFTNLQQRICPVYRTLLVVIILLNHNLGLYSFTRTRPQLFGVRGHGHLTYMCTRRVFSWIARCPTWSSYKGKTGCPSNILPTLFHATV